MSAPSKIFLTLDTSRLILGVFFAFVLFCLVPTYAHAEYIESFKADIDINKDSSFDVVETITYVFTEPRHGIYRFIPLLHAEQPASPLRERYIVVDVGSVSMDDTPVPYTVEDGSEKSVKIGNPDETLTGTHAYRISYTVRGALSYEENGGAELYWDVTGSEWTVPMRFVEVTVNSLDSVLTRNRACYRGIEGDVGSCDTKTLEDGSAIFSARNLNVGEGLTIAQAVNRSVVAHDVRERYKPVLVWGILILLTIIGSSSALYRYKTKYRTGRTIIPQYEPYPGVKPMYAGYLFDKQLDSRDITAGIVYLAREKFVRIKRTEQKVLFLFEVDDYELTLLRPLSDASDPFDSDILTLIFKKDAEVGKTVSLRDLKNDYVGGVGRAKLITGLHTKLTESMKQEGFLTGSFFLTRRTRKGYEALDHLKGFKDFLKVTESQRYIFHNAPAINAEHFMEFLPYAIAFGVERQWAKTFEKITIPQPEWYDGGPGAHAFSAVSLTDSLHGFSTAFATSSGTSASSGGGHSGGGSGGGGGGSW